jgi:NAD(P)-dependent dehydrogenase (short-subunit alcohol dehydrogenase family)
MSELDGLVAVVVGAGRGIGRATATRLAEAGAVVHAIARRAPDGPFTSHAVDATDPDAVAATLGEIGEQSAIDVLVLALGLQTPDRRLDQLTPESWSRLVATNLDASFYCVRAALPYLRATRGLVIALGSVSGVWPDMAGPAYQAAKVGLLAFMRAAAIEELPNEVRFTVIHPGMTDTDMLDKRAQPVPAEIRAHALAPDDVARACVFVAAQPRRVRIPEMTVLPAAIQTQGFTASAPPERRG